MAKAFQVDTDGTLLTGLVSYWNFEGDSNDQIGSNHGSDSNIAYSSTGGKVGQHAVFNGSDGFIDFGTDSSLNIYGTEQPLSVAMWFRIAAHPGATKYWYIGKIYNYRGYAFMITGNTANIRGEFSDSSQSAWLDTYTYSLSLNTWYHAIIVHDPSANRVKLYINASQVSSPGVSCTSGLFSAASDAFKAGCHYKNPATYGYMNGAISELGVWSKVLSSHEILDLYNSGSGNPLSESSGSPIGPISMHSYRRRRAA